MNGDGLSAENLYIINVLSNPVELLDKLIKTSFQEKKGVFQYFCRDLGLFLPLFLMTDKR